MADAYDRYNAGTTVTTKRERSENVSPTFADYVLQHAVPGSVSTDHLQTNRETKLSFFRTLMRSTLHVIADDAGLGQSLKPDDTFLVEFRHLGGNNYVVRHVSFDGVRDYDVRDPNQWVLNSNSIELRTGTVSVNIKRLNGTSLLGENVWVYELMLGGSLFARYYLVPYAFSG